MNNSQAGSSGRTTGSDAQPPGGAADPVIELGEGGVRTVRDLDGREVRCRSHGLGNQLMEEVR